MLMKTTRTRTEASIGIIDDGRRKVRLKCSARERKHSPRERNGHDECEKMQRWVMLVVKGIETLRCGACSSCFGVSPLSERSADPATESAVPRQSSLKQLATPTAQHLLLYTFAPLPPAEASAALRRAAARRAQKLFAERLSSSVTVGYHSLFAMPGTRSAKESRTNGLCTLLYPPDAAYTMHRVAELCVDDMQ